VSAPRSIGQLWSHEHTANDEGRTEQFLHRSNAFGGEELLSFPCFSAAKIAS
jgi:hypothetical protein